MDTKRFYSILSLLVIATSVSAQSWRVKPTDQEVSLGQTATLECSFIDSSNSLERSWTNNLLGNLFVGNRKWFGSSRITLDSRNGNYSLVIANVQKEDFGVYSCAMVSFENGQATLSVTAPPNTSVFTSSVPSAKEGDTVTFTCKSSGGYPTPQLSIYLGNTLLPNAVYTAAPAPYNESKSVVTRVMQYTDDRAVFKCLAFNKENVNNKLERTLRLPVQYKPRIQLSPNPYIILDGSTGNSLFCNVTANPGVSQVTWFKDDDVLTGSTSPTLFINQAQKSSAGIYKCSATNVVGVGSGTTSVLVQYKPEISGCTSPITVDEGRPVNMSCTVQSQPAASSIYWIKQGTNQRTPGSYKTFQSVSRINAGVYTITAENNLTPSGGASTLGKTEKEIRLTVNYPPGPAQITGVLGYYMVGDRVELNCTAPNAGVPAALYSWQKDGSNLATTSGLHVITTATLQNHGRYTCTPQNRLGNGQPASTNVVINERPTFITNLAATAAVSITTQDYKLTCEARGKPAPSITWWKDGKQLSGTGPMFTITDTSSDYLTNTKKTTSELLFKGAGRRRVRDDHLQISDAGAYQCQASNLNVAPIRSFTMDLKIKYQPQIQSSQEKFAVDINSTATIPCMAHAYPAPTFAWKRQGSPVSGRSFTVTSSTQQGHQFPYRSFLTIANVSMVNLGDYVCESTNQEGTSRETLSLTVKNTPEAPTALKVTSSQWDQVTLTWTPGFDGGYEQTFTIIYSYNSNDPLEAQPDNVTEYTVTNLYPARNYTFKVYATNLLGGGPYSNVVWRKTNDLNIPAPVKALYHPENGTITFTATTDSSQCLKVEVMRPNQAWLVEVPCAPVSNGKSSVAVAKNSQSSYRISVCLLDRKDVCSSAVTVSKVDVTDPKVIYIAVGVCAGVLLILLIVLLVCCIRRRRSKKAKDYENEPVNRRTQPVLDASQTSKQRGYDNPGIDLDDPTTEGVFSHPADSTHAYNYTMLEHVAQPNGHVGNGHAPHAPPYTPYPEGRGRLQDNSPDNSLDSTSYDKQNIINEDELTHRSFDVPDYSYAGSRSPTQHQPYHNMSPYHNPYDPYNKLDTSRSGMESGYSTPDPSKPKKVIYEVIV